MPARTTSRVMLCLNRTSELTNPGNGGIVELVLGRSTCRYSILAVQLRANACSTPPPTVHPTVVSLTETACDMWREAPGFRPGLRAPPSVSRDDSSLVEAEAEGHGVDRRLDRELSQPSRRQVVAFEIVVPILDGPAQARKARGGPLEASAHIPARLRD